MANDPCQELAGEVRGTKRPRIEHEVETANDSPRYTHELLTPRATSRGTTPDVINVNEIEYYDDRCHEDVEWIRLPKRRDYDVFRVTRRKPEDRDVNKAEMALTAVRHDKQEVTLWAKMDTGSDTNTINRSTLELLLGAENIDKHMFTMTEEGFNLIGGQTFGAKNCVKLDFWAGQSKKKFEKVYFIVLDVDERTENTDGVPNVLLGWPFLEEHSMLQIDVEYCYEADRSLPVLAERGEDEMGGHAGPLPIVKIRPTAGIPRPTR
ncbi:hypothetical protein LTR85_011446 [Meristemomyces frigidus]|nr:hypothetical protein LTR85_011446 [Meristemomyces frigidus]